MSHHRPTAKTLIVIFSLLFLLFSSSQTNAQDANAGRALFMNNCASCHAVNRKVTGPALAGVQDRVPDPKKLHAWIRNNQAVLKSGDPYFTNLFNEYQKTPMNVFTSFSDADIDNILAYVKKEASVANQPKGPDNAPPAE